MKSLVFYREWFPLPKGEFRIMAMLADKGQFRGSLSALCRYFFVSLQTRNRDTLREEISSLEQKGFITVHLTGRTYTLTEVPKAERIEIAREHYERIRTRARTMEGESVAWECVLKVYLWICSDENCGIITNQMMQADLDLSDGVICSAKNVLSKEFEAIHRHIIAGKNWNGEIRRTGQRIEASSFWNSE